jgi:hypothetical protein
MVTAVQNQGTAVQIQGTAVHIQGTAVQIRGTACIRTCMSRSWLLSKPFLKSSAFVNDAPRTPLREKYLVSL